VESATQESHVFKSDDPVVAAARLSGNEDFVDASLKLTVLKAAAPQWSNYGRTMDVAIQIKSVLNDRGSL
jgi:hypothetical protein